MSMQEKIEDGEERVLTNRQKTFARFIVEGIYSNAEAARKAGFAESTASKHASLLLNGRDYPHVLEYIQEMREERERRYGVTTLGQLERLYKLSVGAEENGQFSAAINAEKIRAALGGLTVDRREQVNTIVQLSRDEIVGRLADLQKKYPQAFMVDKTPKEKLNTTFALPCNMHSDTNYDSGPRRGGRPRRVDRPRGGGHHQRGSTAGVGSVGPRQHIWACHPMP